MSRRALCASETSRRLQVPLLIKFLHNGSRYSKLSPLPKAACSRLLSTKVPTRWLHNFAVGEFAVEKALPTGLDKRERKRKRFSTVEAAVAYYRSKDDWSVEDLTGDCLESRAWRALAKRVDVMEEEDLPLFYPLACFLISLGLDATQVVNHVSSRYNGPLFPPMRVATLASKITFLQQQFGFSRPQLARVVVAHNRILDYSIARTFKPRLHFFEEYFQLRGPALGKLVLRSPQLLSADLEDDVLAKVNLLCGVVGDPQAVASMLARQPGILFCSELSIQDKVRRLVQELELDRTQLPRVLCRAPSLLQRDLSCIAAIVDVLKDFGVPPEELGALCTRYPNVLTLSPDSLRAKLSFCTNQMGLDIRVIISNPALLGMSLKGRLMPRYEALQLSRPDARPLRAYFANEETFQELLDKGRDDSG